MSNLYDSDIDKIRTGGTDTAAGFIPHLLVTSGNGIKLRMPVRIVYSLRDMMGRPFPETDKDGNYYYAYPGGSSLTKKEVLCL
jgi:hypothetical protein